MFVRKKGKTAKTGYITGYIRLVYMYIHVREWAYIGEGGGACSASVDGLIYGVWGRGVTCAVQPWYKPCGF